MLIDNHMLCRICHDVCEMKRQVMSVNASIRLTIFVSRLFRVYKYRKMFNSKEGFHPSRLFTLLHFWFGVIFTARTWKTY